MAIREAPPEERVGMAADILREIIAKVLRLPASKLELDQNINQVGIDSLMALELQTLIAEQTGAEFSPMDFMAGPSITTMAKRLLEKLFPEEHADPALCVTEIHGDQAMPSGSVNLLSPADQALPGQPAQSTRIFSVPDVDKLSEVELDELLTRIMNQEAHS